MYSDEDKAKQTGSAGKSLFVAPFGDHFLSSLAGGLACLLPATGRRNKLRRRRQQRPKMRIKWGGLKISQRAQSKTHGERRHCQGLGGSEGWPCGRDPEAFVRLRACSIP